MRRKLNLMALVLSCIISATSYAGCDESGLEQFQRRQLIENHIAELNKKPRDSLDRGQAALADKKFDFSQLDNAANICHIAAKVYGVSNIWYSFSGDLYVLPYELNSQEANRISEEICYYKPKDRRLTMYFVEKLSTIKMNSIRDVERLGDPEKSYLRVCRD